MDYYLLAKLYYKDKELYEKEYKERYNGISTIKFNFSISKHPAFCVINNEILNLVEKIFINDKRLDLMTQAMPTIALQQYTRNCLIDEIHLTNDIEGVYSTRKEINEILSMSEEKAAKRRLFGLIQKYDMLKKENIPLETCQNIRTLYNELVLPEVIEEDSENIPDGVFFRKDHAYVIGANEKQIHAGVYPEEEIIDLMNNSLAVLNNGNLSYLIKIAIFHYLFGYIHPFYDGNGRTSRFISSYLLSQNLNKLISYSLSYTIKINISKYYKSFKVTNDTFNRGDLTPFVINFIEIINSIYDNLFQSLSGKMEKLEFYYNVTEKIINNDVDFGNVVFILFQQSLFSYEGVSIKELVEFLHYGETKIRNYLKKLDNLNLLIKNRSGHSILYDIDLERAKTI